MRRPAASASTTTALNGPWIAASGWLSGRRVGWTRTQTPSAPTRSQMASSLSAYPSAAAWAMSAASDSRSAYTTGTRVLGIVNGTTNFILDEMATKGLGFDEALATAQELG